MNFVLAFGQPKIGVIWEQKITNENNVEGHQIIQNLSGDYVTIGTVVSGLKQRKDIYFSILDQEGTIKSERIIKTSLNEEMFSIIQNIDGSYILGGYIEGEEKTEAWLLQLNEDGDVLSDISLGNGKILNLVNDENGNIYVTGELEDQILFAVLDWKFNLLEKKELEAGVGQGIYYDEKVVYLTGYEDTKNNTIKLIKLKVDLGKVQVDWSKSFENGKGVDVLVDKANNVLITGLDTPTKRQEDLLVSKIDPDGQLLWRNKFGGLRRDGGNSIVETKEGNYLIAGYNQSFKKGAKTPKGWLIHLDEKGESLWQDDFYFGEGQAYRTKDIIQLNHKDFMVVGVKSYGVGNEKKDTWLWKIEEDYIAPTVSSTDLVFENNGFVDTNNDKVLEASERGFWKVLIHNKSDAPVHGLTFRLDEENFPKGESDSLFIEIANYIEIGKIEANSYQKISIPISGKELINDGLISLTANIFLDSQLIKKIDLPKVVTQSKLETKLVFDKAYLQSFKDSIFEIGKANQIQIKIANLGNQTANGFQAQILLPDQVYAIKTKDKYALPLIAEKTSEAIDFSFIVDRDYHEQTIPIKCAILDSLSNLVAETLVVLPIQNQKEMELPSAPPNMESMAVGWNEKIISDTIHWEEASVELEFWAHSTSLIGKNNFKLFIEPGDGVSANGEKSMDRSPEIKCMTTKDEVENYYTAKCTCEVFLEKGDNKIKVQVAKQNDTIATTERIYHLKSNLYLFAVGIPYTDLNYTQKDAHDFVNSFGSQDRWYHAVKTFIYTEPAETVTDELRKRFIDLQGLGSTIRPFDQLIVFISGHGIIDEKNNKELLIPCSDFKGKKEVYKTLYSLSLKEDIIEKMEAINCQKTLFLDACKSGGNEMESYFFKSQDQQLQIIASCSSNENSYEDKSWKNGAFTKSILEAIANHPFKTGGKKIYPDLNNDTAITLSELKAYISTWVPTQVKKVKNKPQHPYYLPENPKKDQVIFKY